MGCAIIPPRRRVGKNYPNGFNPDSFTIAREIRGKSQEDIARLPLARKVGITAELLAAIEMGRREPTKAEVGALAMMTDFPIGHFRRPADEGAGFDEALIWLCSRGKKLTIDGCCRCAYLAEFLCDFPIGAGKTCDLPLCESHRVRQGDLTDIDYCPQHALIALGLVTPPPDGAEG